jgi:glycosyltransferase involved in cell wall biosynthesis
MPTIPLFSFIIPTLNEETYLPNCVRSILSQAEAGIEIIVADNGSHDQTVPIALDMGCRVVSEPQNGLSFARNAGARAASGELLCFIDADCTLATGWLRAARACFARQEAGYASGPSIYVHPNPLKFALYNLYMLAVSGGGLVSSLVNRPIFAGNNFAIRRELFQQAGGYEDVIGEGLWLSRRLLAMARSNLTGRPHHRGVFCPGMMLWNSPRGFETLGFFRTVHYWITSSAARKSQRGYTYKTR